MIFLNLLASEDLEINQKPLQFKDELSSFFFSFSFYSCFPAVIVYFFSSLLAPCLASDSKDVANFLREFSVFKGQAPEVLNYVLSKNIGP